MSDGVNRNKPCSCGSGKKYKNCCLKKSLADEEKGRLERIKRIEEAEKAKIAKAERLKKNEKESIEILEMLTVNGIIVVFEAVPNVMSSFMSFVGRGMVTKSLGIPDGVFNDDIKWKFVNVKTNEAIHSTKIMSEFPDLLNEEQLEMLKEFVCDHANKIERSGLKNVMYTDNMAFGGNSFEDFFGPPKLKV